STDVRSPAMRRRTRESGFTLIEMMVVMVIIGLLVALVGPNFIRQGEKAKGKAARAQLEMLGTALDTFRLDVGRYPTTQEGPEAPSPARREPRGSSSGARGRAARALDAERGRRASTARAPG